MREILLNVISNAIKYTPEGGHIAVSVKELPAEKPKTGRYTFTVQDDGIGMSEEYLPHIFEEFTREHTSTESKVIGTGLGLPIVKARGVDARQHRRAEQAGRRNHCDHHPRVPTGG